VTKISKSVRKTLWALSKPLRVAVAASAVLGFVQVAQAQEACSIYVVQDGDTLGAISMTAYGTLDYQTLFNANADLLRADPTALAAGTELRIPCADGRLTEAEVVQPIAEAVAAEAVAAETTTGEYHQKIRVLTGGDWFPFTDET
jgi:hypothetical protein